MQVRPAKDARFEQLPASDRLACLRAGLIAVHILALLFWIFQVFRSGRAAAKPAAKKD